MFDYCEVCGAEVIPITNGDYTCYNCGNNGNTIHELNMIKTIVNHPEEPKLTYDNSGISIIEEPKENKYVLAYSKKNDYYDAQTTYLVREEDKTIYKFYSDGYEGYTAEAVKEVLDFLNIKYSEWMYTDSDKLREKYRKDYKFLG